MSWHPPKTGEIEAAEEWLKEEERIKQEHLEEVSKQVQSAVMPLTEIANNTHQEVVKLRTEISETRNETDIYADTLASHLEADGIYQREQLKHNNTVENYIVQDMAWKKDMSTKISPILTLNTNSRIIATAAKYVAVFLISCASAVITIWGAVTVIKSWFH